MVTISKPKAKKIEVPKKMDLSKLIEKEIPKVEKKQEPIEEAKIPEFSFNINEVFRKGRLSVTLEEDNEKKQTLEETTKDAPKKEEVKDETKKIYENLYSQNNQLYKNHRRDEPEIRVNSRIVNNAPTIANNPSLGTITPLRRTEMIREDRFSMGRENDNNQNHPYETSKRRDPTDINPFSPEMEIKEKKYKI